MTNGISGGPDSSEVHLAIARKSSVNRAIHREGSRDFARLVSVLNLRVKVFMIVALSN
jgi:hypothetical protein